MPDSKKQADGDAVPSAADGVPAPGSRWPGVVTGVFEESVTAEFASLTATGRPIAAPATPYVGEAGSTLDVSTGLSYPAKAERARRNPKVCLLYGDPVGSRINDQPVVMVQGFAAVRDADLQKNADRYVAASIRKLPDATKGAPRFVLKQMNWYFSRIWIEVTPVRMLWWPDRSLSVAPSEWKVSEGAQFPASDPPPAGKPPTAWLAPAPSWREVAAEALVALPMRDLTVVAGDGFPVCVPVEVVDLDGDGFVLRLGPGAPVLQGGPSCLTFHGHPEVFTGQENRTFVGSLGSPDPNGGAGLYRFAGTRVLADWSKAGGRIRSSLDFWLKGRVLKPRLRAEAARRGQAVPKVRFRSS